MTTLDAYNCSVCTMLNEGGALVCAICTNVRSGAAHVYAQNTIYEFVNDDGICVYARVRLSLYR
jgi:hypothetical protein